MRLIDADEISKRMNELCDLNCPHLIQQRDVMCSACLWGDAIDIVDGVAVVRELAEENKDGAGIVVESMDGLVEKSELLSQKIDSSMEMTQELLFKFLVSN